jgi:hypothetical protein
MRGAASLGTALLFVVGAAWAGCDDDRGARCYEALSYACQKGDAGASVSTSVTGGARDGRERLDTR